MKRKTHEEYVEELKVKLPYIKVIDQYDGNRAAIQHYCMRHNKFWYVSPFNLLQHGIGCPECAAEALKVSQLSRRKSNESFIQEVMELKTGIIPIDKYDGCHTKIHFKCSKGHIWEATPHDILSGFGCPYCSGNKVLKGYNDLWTTNPEIAKLLVDKKLGYKVSRGSHQKLEFACPDCGSIKLISPKQVEAYGLGCNICSDGISYPNKFIINLLKQIGVQHLIPEWSPDWLKPYRYDAHFSFDGKEYVVEMDGGIGHGECGFNTNSVDYDSIQRDVFKDELAKQHDVQVVRIDCKYTDMKIRYCYIKNSILKSELANILDLSIVDFDVCNQLATTSLSIAAAKKYDNGESIREISENMGIPYDTIYSWIKRLAKEGLCSYTPVKGRSCFKKKKE